MVPTMSRSLFALLLMILLPVLFLAADPQGGATSVNSVEVKLNGPSAIKLCEGEFNQFNLSINNPYENISKVNITIEIPECLEYKGTVGGNLTEYLTESEPKKNGNILIWNVSKSLGRGNYLLEFKLEPKCLGGPWKINAIVEYIAELQKNPYSKSGNMSVKIEKPDLSISDVKCSVSIWRDAVNMTCNMTIKNKEPEEVYDINVTCNKGSGVSCHLGQHGKFNLSQGESRTLRLDVSVTGGLVSLEQGKNLMINFTVSCGNCNITNRIVKIPIVLPKLSKDPRGLNVSISNQEKGFSLSDISIKGPLREEVIKGNTIIIDRLRKGGNITLPLGVIDIDRALLKKENITLYVNGSLNNTFNIRFNISRTYELDIRELKFDHRLPYFIVVKGAGKSIEVYVDDKTNCPRLRIGNDTLLVLLRDMFVPGFREVSIRVAYLNVADGEIELTYGDYSSPVLGGVGTLILFLVVLFALAIKAGRRVREIPYERFKEAPEHVELG